MNEIFNQELSPMLFYESDVFDSQDYIYELKFDGIRCLAYLEENKTTLINKRQKELSSTYPELSKIHKQVNKPCIVDGEIVIMNNGKPDFYQLQKRSLMANSLKIKLQAAKLPVIFVAFDILYLDDKLTIDLPLLERKQLLQSNLIENPRIVISRYIDGHGSDFFELTKKQQLEGIVAKEKTSKYYPGKRSRVWLKIKVYQEDHLIICGYLPKENGIKELILGSYDDNNNIYKVASVVTSKDQQVIINFANQHPSTSIFDLDNNDIIWMEPYLVGRVRYMMKTKSGGLRQPVFVGVCSDKTAEDLTRH